MPFVELEAAPKSIFWSTYVAYVDRFGSVPTWERVGSIEFPKLPGVSSKVTLPDPSDHGIEESRNRQIGRSI